MTALDDTARIRIGISGWRYTPWRGVFYPESLPQRLELAYASRLMGTIEINGSFYSLQRPEHFAQWFDETPPDFEFAVKGPRFITHMKRLKDVRTPLANFFASGVFNLRHKLGPILWQFPPQQRFHRQRFADFLELLPADTAAALRLARRRDVYCYFDNTDVKLRAPFDAMALMRKLGLATQYTRSRAAREVLLTAR